MLKPAVDDDVLMTTADNGKRRRVPAGPHEPGQTAAVCLARVAGQSRKILTGHRCEGTNDYHDYNPIAQARPAQSTPMDCRTWQHNGENRRPPVRGRVLSRDFWTT